MMIVLDALINIAGAALEAEDRYILGCSAVIGKKGGILRFLNEHYYQFIACRGWHSHWDTNPEQASHDAVISVDGVARAIVEMKRWHSPKGEREIPKIQKDIEKLKNAQSGSAWPAEKIRTGVNR